MKKKQKGNCRLSCLFHLKSVTQNKYYYNSLKEMKILKSIIWITPCEQTKNDDNKRKKKSSDIHIYIK